MRAIKRGREDVFRNVLASADAYNRHSFPLLKRVLLFGPVIIRSRLSDSTDYNYPTRDEPTREFTSADDGSESLQFSSTSAICGGVPEQIGDYAIRELIGAGGMGQVFLAEHTRMQRIVAVKMLPVDD